MQALVIVDAQNEFSAEGLRAVPNHAEALACIQARVEEARRNGLPIANSSKIRPRKYLKRTPKRSSANPTAPI